MRYMVFVKMSEHVGDPPPALVDAMSREMGQAFADGSMVMAGGLYPASQSTEIRVDEGAVTTVDGPYAEVKEVIGGFSVLEVDSDEKAHQMAGRVVELHREHWPSWNGAVEIRRIAGPDVAE